MIMNAMYTDSEVEWLRDSLLVVSSCSVPLLITETERETDGQQTTFPTVSVRSDELANG